MRILVIFLVALLLIYLVWLGFLRLQYQRILYPGSTGISIPVTFEPPDDVIVFQHKHEQGHSEVWLLPARAAVRDEPVPAPLVVFAHGNGERIEHWASGMEFWREMGFHVLLPEYRGYGKSTGVPSEDALVADFAQIVSEVVARPEVDGSRIIYHGRSLGGGVLASLTRERSPDAMVLESTFESVAAMAKRFLVPAFLLPDRYETRSTLERTRPPLLLLHGVHDNLVPYTHAERLHQAIPGSRLVSMQCAHNDCPGDLALYREHIASFVREHIEMPTSETVDRHQ